MPPDVQAAFRAVAAWAAAAPQTTDAQQSKTQLRSGVPATQLGQVTRGAITQPAINSPLSRPSITSDFAVRAILQNSAMSAPIEMNSSVVFKAGTSSTMVGMGSGGVIAYNSTYEVGGYNGYTFGISAADGSFFFGPEDWGVGVTDHSRKQILFDAASGVFQIGSDVVVKRSSGALETLETIASASGYTSADLAADLAAGVGTVIAGAGQDYLLTVNNTNIVAAHKDVVFQGYSAAADAANTRRAALGITANGIIMGYNDVNGNWVSSIAIDATTGTASFTGAINATSGNFTGTINAGSVITNSVTVDGTTLNTIKTGAAAGATALQAASIVNLIDRTANTVLAGTISPASGVANAGAFKIGTITWDTSGAVTGGTGVAITANGIIGRNASGPSFSIDVNGNATYAGTLTASQVTSGTFTGVSVATSGSISSTGVSAGALGNVSIYASVTGASHVAVGGLSTNGTGVYGKTSVAGQSGVYGDCATSGGTGVTANGTGGAIALAVNGPMTMSSASTVTNLSAYYLQGYPLSDFPRLAGSAEAGSYSATYRAPAVWGGINVWVLLQPR